MTEYVVGFVFNEDRNLVVLIEKRRPIWQKNSLNGVGGHIEIDELPIDAMIREFSQEADLNIPKDKWSLFATGVNESNSDKVYFFKAFVDLTGKIHTATDEPVYIIPIDQLKDYKKVYNLDWLIPLALDNKTITTVFTFNLNF